MTSLSFFLSCKILLCQKRQILAEPKIPPSLADGLDSRDVSSSVSAGFSVVSEDTI